MKIFLATCAASLFLLAIHPTRTPAQEPPKDAKPAAATDAKTPDANPPKEETWPSDHAIKINNQSITYKAVASTTLLKDEKGEPTALLYATAYTRSDTKDFSQRPIAFLYNGGPGSASIWLHMGAFGPRRVVNADHASASIWLPRGPFGPAPSAKPDHPPPPPPP